MPHPLSVYARYPRNGKTAKEAAAQVGTSARTAQRWTSEPRDTYLGRIHDRHKRIRELRATGMTMRAIANQIGCSVGTVHYALQQNQQPQRNTQ